MTTATDSGPTRQRLIEVAIELFGKHSVAGTSLQMISDALGLTKSAIYHHFRTREELLDAILEPILADLAVLVDAAESQRTPKARADRMLVGYAALAASNRKLISVLSGDPHVAELVRTKPEWSATVTRQMHLLAETDPGVGGLVNAAVVMSGFAGAARGEFAVLDDEALRDQLVVAGRRTLGLRTVSGR